MSLMNYGFTKKSVDLMESDAPLGERHTEGNSHDSNSPKPSHKLKSKTSNALKSPKTSPELKPLKHSLELKSPRPSQELKSPKASQELKSPMASQDLKSPKTSHELKSRKTSQELKNFKSPQKKNLPEDKLVKSSNKSISNSPESPAIVSKMNFSYDAALHYSPFAHKGSSDLSLPPQRVKMIMRSCPDVEIVPHEALHLITKATELFIQHLTTESLLSSENKNKVDYESLSNHIHSCKSLEFLKETIPKKLTLEECQKIIALRNSNKLNECI